jgi:hypothetical protein
METHKSKSSPGGHKMENITPSQRGISRCQSTGKNTKGGMRNGKHAKENGRQIKEKEKLESKKLT